MTSSACLDLLRRANAHLNSFFARFSGAPVLGVSEEVEALRQVEKTLRAVGALLDEGFDDIKDRETQDEIAQYRANLIRLRRELAIMQGSALDRRTRLFARQKHLHAAQAWTAASRATH